MSHEEYYSLHHEFDIDDFHAEDQTWFVENPDRSFRYHIVDGLTAARLVNLEQGAPLHPEDRQERFILSYRDGNEGGIAHSWVNMPLDEARTRMAMAAEHPADALGLWLLNSDVPISPRPNRDLIPMSWSAMAFLGRLTAP